MRLPDMQPFFLDGSAGRLFCLYQPPAESPKGVVLYVPPFAEEMNKTRRMMALQSRSLSRAGFGFLCIDLFGTGDSQGSFGDASWEIWKTDLQAAVEWINARFSLPLNLIGVRMGALLCMDFAVSRDFQFEKIALWQPITKGELGMNQFLRLKVAAAMARNTSETIKDIRFRLKKGDAIQVAGYRISPKLTAAIDSLEMVDFLPDVKTGIAWFEISHTKKISPASEKVLQAWGNQHLNITTTSITGQQFWATQEISVCQELIDTTTAFFQQSPKKTHTY